MSKKVKIILVIVFIVVGIGISGKLIIDSIEKNLEAMMAIEIDDIDLTSLSDGTYIGEYKATPIYVKLEVTISNHIITDITILEHQNGQGDDAVQIISDIIDAQHLNVDLISGASYSSKVILLAVFDALNP